MKVLIRLRTRSMSEFSTRAHIFSPSIKLYYLTEYIAPILMPDSTFSLSQKSLYHHCWSSYRFWSNAVRQADTLKWNRSTESRFFLRNNRIDWKLASCDFHPNRELGFRRFHSNSREPAQLLLVYDFCLNVLVSGRIARLHTKGKSTISASLIVSKFQPWSKPLRLVFNC